MIEIAMLPHRNPAAHDDELILVGFAEAPGKPWKSIRELDAGALWELVEDVWVDYRNYTGLLARGRNRPILRIPGARPILLFVSHGWSGMTDFRFGIWANAMDMFSVETRIVLIDLFGGVRMEPNMADIHKDGQLHGIAPDASGLVHQAAVSQRSVRLLRSPVRAFRSLAARYPHLRPLSSLWIRGPGEVTILALLDGLLAQRSSKTSHPSGKGVASDRVILLEAAVEGLSRRVREG